MSDFTPTPATKEQYVLESSAGGRSLRAVITEVAAAVRHLSVDGIEITAGYPDDVTAPFGSGTVLVPWPNRVRDGKWHHEGATLQLDITEPKYHNAIHGLLRWAPYRLVEKTDDAVELSASVPPQNGYPFHLETAVRYELHADGLHVTHRLRNVGAAEAPVAVGTHPFLAIGDVPTDELTITVDAAVHIEVDDRLNPTGRTGVEGTEWDLRSGRLIGELELDDAWADVRLVDGISTHGVSAPDGRTVSLWADSAHNYVQVFITRIFPVGDDVMTAIAVEPMTAPADSFNSGDGLRWLEPGEEWTLSWGIRHDGFPQRGA